jgi:hypothetical protein
MPCVCCGPQASFWRRQRSQTNAYIPRKKTFVSLSLNELDRKPSSCPYLYTWNGERFEFITDFMGGGEMGHLDAPGLL